MHGKEGSVVTKQSWRGDEYGFLSLYALFLLSVLLLLSHLLLQRSQTARSLQMVSDGDIVALYHVRTYLEDQKTTETSQTEGNTDEPAQADEFSQHVEHITYKDEQMMISYEESQAICEINGSYAVYQLVIAYDREAGIILSYSYV